MKKTVLAITILLISLSAQAQKIETDEMNVFNKRVITTTWEKVNWKSQTHKLEVSMKLEGFDMSMLLNWQSSEMVGAERDSEIILSFDDGSQSILHNKVFSVSGAGKITTKNVPNTQMGIQIDGKGDFKDIVEKELQNIQINTTSGVINFPVSTNEALALRKLFLVFEKQVFKYADKNNEK